jgi:hypothetical protein
MIFGMQPYVDQTRKTTWKKLEDNLNKNGRQLQKKMEDDLNKFFKTRMMNLEKTRLKNGRCPHKKFKK